MPVINWPILYINDPLVGRPLFQGQIFVGEPDTDPEIVINQKQLSVVEEDGTVVPVPQPFVISNGGNPVYNGNPVRLSVDGNYSIKILSKLGAQVYYIDNVFEGQPLVASGFTAVQELTTATMTANGGTAAGYVVQTSEFSTGNSGGGTYDTVLTSSVTPNAANVIIGVSDPLISFVLRDQNQTDLISSQFGIVGSGDETAAITAFFERAIELKKSVWFTNGTYIFNPTSTFDLSGIPKIDGDSAILDVSSAAATRVFDVEGGRSAVLASSISISEGESISATIDTNDLDVNDILVLISLEALPNTERPSYYKSGMFVVYGNDGVGNIVVQPPVPYDFTTSAFLYRMDLQKFVLGSGITFLGKTSAPQECFEVRATDTDVYSTFLGFNGDVVRYVTSRGKFEGKVRSVSGSLGGGVDIDDASDVNVNADISCSFHAVDSGGGTSYWNGSFAGGSAGTNTALSCRYVVSGGFYSSKSDFNGTINAHGNTDKVVIGNCQINGSTLNVSARVNVISNVIIEGDQNIMLRWGSDNNSKDWCDIDMTNVRVKRYGLLSDNFAAVEFATDGRSRDININGLYIESSHSGTAELEAPLSFLGQCRSLKVRNVTLEDTNNSRAMYARLFSSTVYEFENVWAIDGHRIVFDAQEADVNIKMINVSTRNVAASGIILEVEAGMNYNKVEVIDCEGVNTVDDGLNATNVKYLSIKGGDFSNNDAGGGRGVKALLTQNLRMSNVNLSNNGRAFDQTDFGTGSTASVIGCDVTPNAGDMDGSLGAGCTWEARTSNQGDSKDYFRQDDGLLYLRDFSTGLWVAV